MSFSATWGNQEFDVCQTDAAEDLVLEKAVLSPPLEQLADDVKRVVEECALVAQNLIESYPKFSGTYSVSAYGHVRQGEEGTDNTTTTIQISEKTKAVI